MYQDDSRSFRPRPPDPQMIFVFRSVESFFNNVPFAPHVIHKPRFMARLRLPPKHKDFPHPALLHAICAVTARFIGGVVLLPADPCVLMAKPRFPTDDRNQLPIENARPVWNGYGVPPSAGLTPGRDEDFGQIHLSWSRMYIDKVSMDHSRLGVQKAKWR